MILFIKLLIGIPLAMFGIAILVESPSVIFFVLFCAVVAFFFS